MLYVYVNALNTITADSLKINLPNNNQIVA